MMVPPKGNTYQKTVSYKETIFCCCLWHWSTQSFLRTKCYHTFLRILPKIHCYKKKMQGFSQELCPANRTTRQNRAIHQAPWICMLTINNPCWGWSDSPFTQPYQPPDFTKAACNWKIWHPGHPPRYPITPCQMPWHIYAGRLQTEQQKVPGWRPNPSQLL